jgi:putative radical SAM enzyme (TIGR03279 family)
MKTGLRIRSLPRDGFLFAAGLRQRDNIVSVNGSDIIDELDFYYHAAQSFLEIEIERNGRYGIVEVERLAGAGMQVDFFENPVNRCTNRCAFCFIDQMPKGLRRSLYVKDEDFKHSFLNGNYITLTSASKEDLKRIASIGLSPIFVSIHATDKDVRTVMLGNKRIPDINQQLSYLADNGIAFHTQIVLCPGINDGKILERTVADLFGYGKSLLSIAVVPVGLTKFRKKPLAPVDKACAADVCQKMEKLSTQMKQRGGVRKLFVADEFFIKADLPIPSTSYYEDYPQIENGVGLVRQLLQEGAKIKRQLRDSRNVRKKNNSLVITARSAYPYLKKVLADISQYTNTIFDIKPVTNHFFGETVTVTGLLTAKDVINTIKQSSSKTLYREAILPKAMFNHEGYTLDGYSSSRISKTVNLKIKIAGSIEEVLGMRNSECGMRNEKKDLLLINRSKVK